MNTYEGHTPGPWKRGGFLGRAVFAAEKWVATCWEENAALVADAPMLLAQRDALVEGVKAMLQLEERRTYELKPCPCSGCKSLRAILKEIEATP